MDRKVNGYIKDPKKIKCHRELFEQIIVYRAYYTDSQFTIICHTVDSCCMNFTIQKENPWIPIPQTVIDRYCSGFKKRHRVQLVKDGILECDEEFERTKKCFCFRMGPVLKEKVFIAFILPGRKLREGKFSSFTNFRGRRGSPKFSEIQKEPLQIKTGITMIRVNKIDYEALEEEIDKELQEMKECTDPTLKEKLQYRIVANNYCYSSILQQGFVCCEDEGIATYSPAYKGSNTGRMYEIGGGMQNMSKEIKAAAYGRFLNTGEMFNYDLRSSQVAILLQLGLQWGLSESSCYTLQKYIDDKQSKYKYAKKAGMPVDLWKDCFLSLLFGASLHNKEEGDSIYQTIEKWSESYQHKEILTSEQISKMFQGFLVAVKPFIIVRSEWFSILRSYLKKIGKDKIQNAVGKIFVGEKRSNILSAFLLQGLEAAFIQRLVSLSNKYGYEVYSLEHDGILVNEKIPEEAIKEAKTATGFHFAILEEKGFV